MRPVFQAIPGPDGDCYAACVASLLEVELAEVPDLAAAGDRWASALRGWLAARGLRVGFRPGDGRPLADQSDPPRGYAIAGQRALDGSVHAVVCRDGRIVHDPSPRPFGHPRWPVVLWTLIREPIMPLIPFEVLDYNLPFGQTPPTAEALINTDHIVLMVPTETYGKGPGVGVLLVGGQTLTCRGTIAEILEAADRACKDRGSNP